MQNAIISIFCHVDNFFKAISWNDEPQSHMTLAEVITVGLVSWRFFQGNLETARIFLHDHGYITNILIKSRLNRRLHDVPSFFWHLIVAHLFYQFNPCSKGLLIDSIPVSLCHNVRSNRRALFTGQKYVGYNASKQAWFTGLKVHILTTFQGSPREFLLTPAWTHDLTAFKKIYLGSLLKGSIILGDKAYISSEQEKALIEKDLHLITERRKNSRKGQSFIYHRYGRRIRKKIESTFSKISSWLPKHIHAVTDRGFVLKLMMLIAAFSITF